jgi:hypothetical protein
MTTTDSSLGAGTPAGATPTAGTPPAAAAATPAVLTPPTPPAAAAAPPAEDPNWLKPRLERERNAGVKQVLKEAGFESIEDAKAAATAAKAAADANKTATQKATELATQLSSQTARADALSAIATEHAARMMVGLTAEQQAAVKALAGDDPAKQLATIGALVPTWAKADGDAASKAAATAAAAAAAKATTASTAPAGGAPNGATPVPTSPRGVYESQRNTNPFAAALFGIANPEVYSPPK